MIPFKHVPQGIALSYYATDGVSFTNFIAGVYYYDIANGAKYSYSTGVNVMVRNKNTGKRMYGTVNSYSGSLS